MALGDLERSDATGCDRQGQYADVWPGGGQTPRNRRHPRTAQPTECHRTGRSKKPRPCACFAAQATDKNRAETSKSVNKTEREWPRQNGRHEARGQSETTHARHLARVPRRQTDPGRVPTHGGTPPFPTKQLSWPRPIVAASQPSRRSRTDFRREKSGKPGSSDHQPSFDASSAAPLRWLAHKGPHP